MGNGNVLIMNAMFSLLEYLFTGNYFLLSIMPIVFKWFKEIDMSSENKQKKIKPIGSGIFSSGVGVVFVLVFICSIRFNLRKVDPYKLFQSWLLFAAAILTIWGSFRIIKVIKNRKKLKKGKLLEDDPLKLRWEIGQSTLNFVVGVIAATVAIFALLHNLGA